jgi:hypothetical protein
MAQLGIKCHKKYSQTLILLLLMMMTVMMVKLDHSILIEQNTARSIGAGLDDVDFGGGSIVDLVSYLDKEVCHGFRLTKQVAYF